MASRKEFSISGVGPDVQVGRRGARIIFDSGTGDVQFFEADGSTLTNLDILDPVDPTHAATKAYVDAIQGGLDAKDACRLSTTATLTGWTVTGSGIGKTLTAPTSATSHNDFDAVTAAVGDRILVKNGPTAVDNGIYTLTVLGDGGATSAELTRATDQDEDTEFTQGNYTLVVEGATLTGAGFLVDTGDPITVDTTAVTWLQFNQSTTVDPLVRRQVLGTGATQSIGTPVPATARIEKVQLEVTTPYSAAATISIEDDGVPIVLMGTLENDAELADVYSTDANFPVLGGTQQLQAIIGGAPGAGASVAVVTYRIP